MITASTSPDAAATAVAATIALFAAGMLARTEHQRRSTGQPTLLPAGSGTALGPGLWCGAMLNAGLQATELLTAVVLLRVRGQPPAFAGASLLVVSVPLAGCGAIAGPTIARYGPRRVVSAGLALAAMGTLILAFATTAHAAVILLISGWAAVGAGCGLTAPAMTALTLTAAPREQLASVTGLLSSARHTGGVLSAAGLGGLGLADPVEGSRIALLVITAAWAATAATTWPRPTTRSL